MFSTIFEQSLLFFPLSLGIYISYTILKTADLTTDGSFLIGAAIYAISIKAGCNPYISLIPAMMAGMIPGAIVALIQTKYSLNPLIAGVLVVFILNALTLKIMGRPNISLLEHQSICVMPVLIGMSVFLSISFALLFSTKMGVMLYGLGANSKLIELMGKNVVTLKMLGLSLSNMIVAFSGALASSASGFADISMGTGMILIGLGTVILGKEIYESIYKAEKRNHLLQIFCVFLGVFVYFSLVHMLLHLGIDPIFLKIAIGITLIVFLIFTNNVKQKAQTS